MSHLPRASGMRRARSLTLLGTLGFVAVAASGCGGCDTSTANTVKITGPDRVVAGAPAQYKVDGQTLADHPELCPDLLNWHFEGKNVADPARNHPRTRREGTLPKTRCVIDGETATHVFPAGRPGTEYASTVSVELDKDVADSAFGEKTVIVSTPAGAHPASLPAGGFGFSASKAYAAGQHPSAVTRVGASDVAVADDESDPTAHDEIIPFKSNGDGTVTARSPIDLGPARDPSDLASADFNRDGIPDLVASEFGHGEVHVIFGSSDGTWGSPMPSTVGQGPVSVAVGDLNNDGYPDIVTSGTDGISVLLNVGATVNGTTFQSFAGPYSTGGTGPQGVGVGDIDGDGHPDVVVADSTSDQVMVLPNNGNGSLGTAKEIGTHTPGRAPQAVAVGDLNGDGTNDVAVANQGLDTISIMLNTTTNASTSFSETQYPSSADPLGKGPNDVTVGDFNDDGNKDVASANTSPGDAQGTSSVLLGDGAGGFGGPLHVTMGKAPVAVAAAWINSDHSDDLAVANSGTFGNSTDGSLTIALSEGSTSTSRARAVMAAAKHHRVGAVRAVGGFHGIKLISLGRASYGAGGVGHIRGAVVRTQLAAKLSGSRRARRRVPAAIRKALNANVVARLDATRYPGADGIGPVVVKGIAVARSRKDRRALACMRVSFDNRPGRKRSNRVTFLGGTGLLSRWWVRGTFPPFDLTRVPKRGNVALSIKRRGKRRSLPPSCRSLARRLA